MEVPSQGDDVGEDCGGGIKEFMHATIMVGLTACHVGRAGRMQRWSKTLGVLRF